MTDRRAFIATGLVSGFTLAAGPINAAAILTDTAGLEAGEVSIKVGDGRVPAYRARPKDKTHAPVILVVQEIFGVHEFIKDVCRRLAHQGYYAVAPALYARYGDPGKYDMNHIEQLISDVVSKVPDNEVMGDLDAAVAFAKGEGADTAKLGITGFCWGGRIVWLYAAHNPRVKAGVAWYGPLRGKTDALHPKTAIELAPQIHAPILGNYAGKDMGIPIVDVAEMREALAKGGNTKSRIDIFEASQHGFFADYRGSYNEADAKTGWAHALAWFAENGVK
ncbi:carboxymethylenebutenolidase [Rhizomicrobium palustre]|uniref:Carboxymethylenebutenolidase n=1 Tax=Rhizomicrobium palustre TaxID=189966 RepID=A0A846MXM9_9PROT|nr:dienelactone hydrolase family protein [Rhizomicrobium palustre]NIK88338.1 carboxymethylenebutenolidase [Rhizomicrobium palustre]